MSNEVAVAIIGGIVSISTAVLAYMQNRYHKEVNSKMTEYVKEVRAASEAKGAAENQAITNSKPQAEK